LNGGASRLENKREVESVVGGGPPRRRYFCAGGSAVDAGHGDADVLACGIEEISAEEGCAENGAKEEVGRGAEAKLPARSGQGVDDGNADADDRSAVATGFNGSPNGA